MIALALAALLSFQDPPLDAVGDGSLQAPTAAVYRSLSAYDLRAVEVLDTPFLSLAVTFESLPNPFGLPNGFSLPIVELYLYDISPRPEDAEPLPAGAAELLPGSGMRLPEGARWHYAFRLSGDAAQLFESGDDGPQEVSGRYGVTVSAEGDTITVSSGLERPQGFQLYGVVGSYTPFTDSGWQPISVAPSPWTFSSETQRVPVIDVLAADQETQAAAIQSRTLPAVEVAPPPPPVPPNPWAWVTLAGLAVALGGLVARLRVRAPAAPPAPPSPQPQAPRYRPLYPDALPQHAARLEPEAPAAPVTPVLASHPLPQLPPPEPAAASEPTDSPEVREAEPIEPVAGAPVSTEPDGEPDSEPRAEDGAGAERDDEALTASLLLEHPRPLGEGWRWLEADEDDLEWEDEAPDPTPKTS